MKYFINNFKNVTFVIKTSEINTGILLIAALTLIEFLTKISFSRWSFSSQVTPRVGFFFTTPIVINKTFKLTSLRMMLFSIIWQSARINSYFNKITLIGVMTKSN